MSTGPAPHKMSQNGLSGDSMSEPTPGPHQSSGYSYLSQYSADAQRSLPKTLLSHGILPPVASIVQPFAPYSHNFWQELSPVTHSSFHPYESTSMQIRSSFFPTISTTPELAPIGNTECRSILESFPATCQCAHTNQAAENTTTQGIWTVQQAATNQN